MNLDGDFEKSDNVASDEDYSKNNFSEIREEEDQVNLSQLDHH